MSNDPLDIAATAVANMKRIEAAHKVSVHLATLVQTAVKINSAHNYRIAFFIGGKMTETFEDCGDQIKRATLAALAQNIAALHAQIDQLGCGGDVTLETGEKASEIEIPF